MCIDNASSEYGVLDLCLKKQILLTLTLLPDIQSCQIGQA